MTARMTLERQDRPLQLQVKRLRLPVQLQLPARPSRQRTLPPPLAASQCQLGPLKILTNRS